MNGLLRHLLVMSLLVVLVAAASVSAAPVSPERAALAVADHVARLDGQGFHVRAIETLPGTNGRPLAYLFALFPAGYVAVAADDALPPVIAYTLYGAAPADPGSMLSGSAGDPLRDLLRADLLARLASLGPEAPPHPWWSEARGARFQQWPPPGSTPTEGWVEVRWTQNAPYNQFCPLDVAHGGTRSLAGCPAVAMGQILDYLKSGAEIHFDDADDYLHAYYGNNFWFDDDYLAYGFPSWPQLDDHLQALQERWDQGLPSDATGAAALVYACGMAAHQVYSIYGSGTFGVDQALMAYRRFGFSSCELIAGTDPQLLDRLASNMQEALPAHLAVVTPNWQSGHNMVVDGYNSDGYFHVNFGWGGAYDGWYLLPGSLPYDLTVFEGAIVDIEMPATAVGDVAVALRAAAWPNPCNPRTVISYELSAPARVRVEVFDMAGRLVDTLLDASRPAGPGSVLWNGDDRLGRPVATGVYLARVEAGAAATSLKIVVAR